MKIIEPELLTLYERRGAIAAKSFDEICANQTHSLFKPLPSKYQPSYSVCSLREQRTFIRPSVKLIDTRIVFF